MLINVKWGKEVLKDVEIDLAQPPMVFKTQLMSLTGVPVDRQKIAIKALKGFLKDDVWDGVNLKDGQQVMMVGTAESVPEAPKEPMKFLEDLPQADQDHMDMRKYGIGMKNLGNTCYMNSTIQCFYAIPELREALRKVGRQAIPGPDSAHKRLTQIAGVLFDEMSKASQPYMPMTFWMLLKQTFPQFSQQGAHGMFMQQDAEECWSQLMFALKEHVQEPVQQIEGAQEEDQNQVQTQSVVKKLFGIDLNIVLTSEESSEVITENRSELMLKCNIKEDVKYLHQTIELGLQVEREQFSQELARSAIFRGMGRIVKLPPYLTLHLLRFAYRQDTNKKAKILREVQFPMLLDMFDYCDDKVKQELKDAREAWKLWDDMRVDIQKGSFNMPEDGAMEVDPAEPIIKHSNKETGKYELLGVLTHKGRYGDSGHYVAWIKQDDGSWILFDDEYLSIRTEEEVKKLAGGGESHSAYLLLYQVVRIPTEEIVRKELAKVSSVPSKDVEMASSSKE